MRYQFDQFTLDTDLHSLSCEGKELALGERAFCVLTHLVQNTDRALSKEELLDLVWGDLAVVEDNLVQAVGEIRVALGDKPSRARFIKTIHRHGYRFVNPVSLVLQPAEAPSASVGSSATSAPSPAQQRLNKPPRSTHAGLRLILYGTLAGVCITLAIAFVSANWDAGPKRESGFDVSGLESWTMRRLDQFPLGTLKPAFSTDTDLMAFVQSDAETGVHSLFLSSVAFSEPRQLTHGLEVRGPSPVFSADGQRLWFTHYKNKPGRGLVPDVMEVDIQGRETRVLIPDASAASQDPVTGSIVYSSNDGQIAKVVVRQPGGMQRVLSQPGYWPRWSPDGRHIAYTSSNPEGGNGHLWVVDPSGKNRRRLTEKPGQHYGLCWTPDASAVIVSTDAFGTRDLVAYRLSSPGGVRITKGPGMSVVPAFDRLGNRLVFGFTDSYRVVLNLHSPDAEPTEILKAEQVTDVSLSPDGSLLAYGVFGKQSKPTIQIKDLATGQSRRLARLSVGEMTWSADGKVLFATAPAAQGEAFWLWRIGIDGGLPEAVVSNQGSLSSFDLSADGRQVAAVRTLAGKRELVLVDLDSGACKVLFAARGIERVRFSSDGRTLLFAGEIRPADTTTAGIWILPLDSLKPRRLVEDGFWPVWGPDDSILFVRELAHSGFWRISIDDPTPVRFRGFFENYPGGSTETMSSTRGNPAVLVTLFVSNPRLYALERPDVAVAQRYHR